MKNNRNNSFFDNKQLYVERKLTPKTRLSIKQITWISTWTALQYFVFYWTTKTFTF